MKMRRILSINLALCLIPMFVGCATSGDRATPTPTAESIEITVAAAASLTDVTAELAEAYKDVAPNVMVNIHLRRVRRAADADRAGRGHRPFPFGRAEADERAGGAGPFAVRHARRSAGEWRRADNAHRFRTRGDNQL